MYHVSYRPIGGKRSSVAVFEVRSSVKEYVDLLKKEKEHGYLRIGEDGCKMDGMLFIDWYHEEVF